MAQAFDSFVVFAEMRTGSNFLERNLNALDGLTCHGEAFNPHFVGYPDCSHILGMSHESRDRQPDALLDAMIAAPGLNGFRYFHDHDPRVLERLVDDARCAKIILTRDPLDSYVSWKIARSTGQWKLTDVRRRKSASVHFDPLEYAEYVDALSTFRQDLMRQLQVRGQVPFRLTYDDLRSVDVVNGLAAFLGIPARLDRVDAALKVQNPSALVDKVANPDEMALALPHRDLDDVPDFEPRRFASVQSFVAGAKAPLLFLPVPGGPTSAVKEWLARLDAVTVDELPQNMTRKTVRRWKNGNPGHRSFTVVRHPLARAHHAFCKHILGVGPGTYARIRRTLIRRHGLDLPQDMTGARYTLSDHRRAFGQFLTFLQANLGGQTALRVDAAWGSQLHSIQGFCRFAAPDVILREDDLARQLPRLAGDFGYADAGPAPSDGDRPYALDAIYDRALETLAVSAYPRDYMAFGFSSWR